MTELDIRLGVTGIRIDNKDEMIESINNDLNEFKEILEIPCNEVESYRLYKDVRKKIKDERNAIYSTVKEKVAIYTGSILADQKELYGMFDELYNKIDEAIKHYEEENEVGAARAKITRAKNKAANEQTTAALTLTLQCPSEEVKARIMQFATDLGAVVL